MNEVFDCLNMEPLIKLRDYFKTLPKYYGKFKMKSHARDKDDLLVKPFNVPECGTSMCLLGHLPLLGYPGLEDEGWSDYCNRILNIKSGRVWNYLFTGGWPNDIQLAIQRLDDVISKRKSTVKEASNWYLVAIIDHYNSLIE